MADTTTSSGIKISISNTPQANTDSYNFVEDQQTVYYLDVMINDLGGAAKTLYSVDDGSNSTTDLLAKDVIVGEASGERSSQGARLWITSQGTVAYDTSTINDKLQALAEGEPFVDTFSYAIRLGNGTLSWSTVKVTINGVNDAPKVTGVVAGTAIEDGAVSLLDALAKASDVDHGAILGVVDLPATLPPGVTYDADKHSFTLDPADQAYQSLAANETTTVTVRYGVSDGKATTAASVSWTVTGTNDAPVVSGAVTGKATEDGAASTLDALANAADVDHGSTLQVVNVPDAGTLPPGVTYDAATHRFTLDPSAAAYQSLGKDATMTVTVGYGVSDGTATVPASVSWTITGTNDAPTVTAALTANAAEGDAAFTRDLLAGASDPDQGETAALAVTDVRYSVNGGASSETVPGGVSLSGHTLSVDPGHAVFNSLAQGETSTIVVSYMVKDAHGATVAQTETITVTGTNDAPVIGVLENDSAAAALSETNAGLSISGTLTVTDADLSDTSTITVDSVSVGGATAGLDADNAALKAMLTTVQDTLEANPGATHDLTWKFNSGGEAFNYLAEGEQLTLTYTIRASDAHASDTQDVTITITGTNDAPVINTEAANVALGETDSVLSSSGAIGFGDADHNAVVEATLTAANVTPAGIVLTQTQEAAFAAAFTIAKDGQWSFNLPSPDYLAEGQSVKVAYQVTVTDDKGGTASQVQTLTITGANDAPVITAALAAQATEGDVLFTSNLLAGASDVDNGETGFLTVTDVRYSVNGGAASETMPAGVSLSGHSLSVNPAHATFDSLAQGETSTIVVSYKVMDAHGATVAQTETITITGTNDAPTVTAALFAGAHEDDDAFALNLLGNASDVDQGAALSVTNVTGLVDGLTLTGSTLTVNPKDPAFQTLAAGAEQKISISYEVADQHGAKVAQTATITVIGTNDAPKVTGDVAATVNEDAAPVTVDLLATASDIDAGDDVDAATVSYAVTGGSWAGSVAYSVDNETGALRLDPAQFNALGANESVQLTFSYSVVDGKGGSTPANAVVTVTGSNDAPVINTTATDLKLVEGNAALSASGLLGFSDGDRNANVTASLAGATVAATGVTLTDAQVAAFQQAYAITQGGQWSFNLASPDYLAQGQTVQVSYQVNVADDTGAAATQVQTVTVTGANDAPVIGGISTGAVQEDVAVSGNLLTTSGALTIADADAGQSSFAAQLAARGAYGTFTLAANGAWTYSVDNSLSAIQALNAGQFLSDSFNAFSSDGTASRTVAVTINGSNEAPSTTGNTSYSVDATATGTRIISDQGGNDDIVVSGGNVALAALSFEKVGNDLVMQLGNQTVTVQNQYGSNTNTVESIEFGSGQTYYGYQLQGKYTLVTTETPGQSNTNWVLAGGASADNLTGGSNTNQQDLIFGNGSGDTLTGREGNDLLVGGAGNDFLYGMEGNDTLVGGEGGDTFVFNATLNASSNMDHIADFNGNATDFLWLSKGAFSALATAGSAGGTALATGDFMSVNAGAGSTNMGSAHILYDSSTGALYYDATGGGASDRVQFAVLDNKPASFDLSDIKVGL